MIIVSLIVEASSEGSSLGQLTTKRENFSVRPHKHTISYNSRVGGGIATSVGIIQNKYVVEAASTILKVQAYSCRAHFPVIPWTDVHKIM